MSYSALKAPSTFASPLSAASGLSSPSVATDRVPYVKSSQPCCGLDSSFRRLFAVASLRLSSNGGARKRVTLPSRHGPRWLCCRMLIGQGTFLNHVLACKRVVWQVCYVFVLPVLDLSLPVVVAKQVWLYGRACDRENHLSEEERVIQSLIWHGGVKPAVVAAKFRVSSCCAALHSPSDSFGRL